MLAAGAVTAFARFGYHATTSRQIASAAGMSPAGMYVHFSSKAELLAAISRIGHLDALRVIDGGLSSGTCTLDRLARTIGRFAEWHAAHHELARVVQHELDSLPDDARDEVTALRRRTEGLVRTDVAELATLGAALVDDVRATSRALMSVCIDVCRWYRPGGSDTPERVGTFHDALTRRLLEPARAER